MPRPLSPSSSSTLPGPSTKVVKVMPSSCSTTPTVLSRNPSKPMLRALEAMWWRSYSSNEMEASPDTTASHHVIIFSYNFFRYSPTSRQFLNSDIHFTNSHSPNSYADVTE
ncbi:hypothetical protein Fmac_007965 [Flemingia macrophylla]|uniref:Uncharacterized protein n=1 Tax=Flemingia macrophylla TaxID=520843 RepID=A0ABD1MYE8_9FABA